MCSLDPEPNYEDIDPEAEFAIEREQESKIKKFDQRLTEEIAAPYYSDSTRQILVRVRKWFRKEFQEIIHKGPYDE